MAFMKHKEPKANKLGTEEQKELLRALASGMPAERIYDIFKIDNDYLEYFIASNVEEIINKENYIEVMKGGIKE